MKEKNVLKTKPLMQFFLPAFSIVSLLYILLNYYSEFLKNTAGSYEIAVLFGEKLEYFLYQVLTLVIGLISFAFVLIKSKRKTEKTYFPICLTLCGIIISVLPAISNYTVSRFAGTLLTQTITGIAIVANIVFMMLSVCFLCLSVTDIIFTVCKLDKAIGSVCSAMIFAGTVSGLGFVSLCSAIFSQKYGLNSVYTLFGILAVITGILSLPLKRKMKVEKVK